ncbi:hypothetical protein T310_7435, partial [Rasamsonia emersonii CBS 393.64]
DRSSLNRMSRDTMALGLSGVHWRTSHSITGSIHHIRTEQGSNLTADSGETATETLRKRVSQPTGCSCGAKSPVRSKEAVYLMLAVMIPRDSRPVGNCGFPIATRHQCISQIDRVALP